MTALTQRQDAGAEAHRQGAEDVPTIDACSLLGAAGLAEITLGEQRYLLRLTKAGKLILTK